MGGQGGNADMAAMFSQFSHPAFNPVGPVLPLDIPPPPPHSHHHQHPPSALHTLSDAQQEVVIRSQDYIEYSLPFKIDC